MAGRRGSVLLNPAQVRSRGGSLPCPTGMTFASPSAYCKRKRGKSGHRAKGTARAYAARKGWNSSLLSAARKGPKRKPGRPRKARASRKTVKKVARRSKPGLTSQEKKWIKSGLLVQGLGAWPKGRSRRRSNAARRAWASRKRKTSRRSSYKPRRRVSALGRKIRATRAKCAGSRRYARKHKRTRAGFRGVAGLLGQLGLTKSRRRRRKMSRRPYARRGGRKAARRRSGSKGSRSYMMGLGGELLEINPRHRLGNDYGFNTDYQYAMLSGARRNPYLPGSLGYVFSMDTAVNLGALALGRGVGRAMEHLTAKLVTKFNIGWAKNADGTLSPLTSLVSDLASAMVGYEVGKLAGGMRYGRQVGEMMALGALSGVIFKKVTEWTDALMSKVTGTTVAGLGRYGLESEKRSIGRYGLEPEKRSIGRYTTGPERRALGQSETVPNVSSGSRDSGCGDPFSNDDGDNEESVESQFGNQDLIPSGDVQHESSGEELDVLTPEEDAELAGLGDDSPF